MKHLALVPCLLACASSTPDQLARVYDFSPRSLAEMRVPPHVSSPKGEVVAMVARAKEAIAACHLRGTYQTDFTVELGMMTEVSVTPAAPCLEAALLAADASKVAPDAPLRVLLPLVLDYAGNR